MAGRNIKCCLTCGLFIFSFAISLPTCAIGSAIPDYGYGSKTVNELDDIFELLREKYASMVDEESKWSDAVDAWIANTEDDNLVRIEGMKYAEYGGSLTRESVWQLWNTLRTTTREHVVRKLYPLLIPSASSSGKGWRLHCADAYKLCMADTNCYWKYKNYLSSCTEGDLSVLDEAVDTQDEYNSDLPDRQRDSMDVYAKKDQWKSRHAKRGNRSVGRRQTSKLAPKKSVKRDVFEMERRIRKEVRVKKQLKRKHRQKSILWMGQYFGKQNQASDDNLRFFSMKAKSSRCSSKCVHSLIMLNETVYGALLAHCDCRIKTMPSAYISSELTPKDKDYESENWEQTCMLHQRTAQSCRPRFFRETAGVIGCTAARHKCEKDAVCKEAQNQFLSRCSQVINGLHCTTACKDSVHKLRNVTRHYDTCICDSAEGPTCRQIRNNVIRLCDVTVSHKPLHSSERELPKGDKPVSIGEALGKETRKFRAKNNSKMTGHHNKVQTKQGQNDRNSAGEKFRFSKRIFLLAIFAFTHHNVLHITVT